MTRWQVNFTLRKTPASGLSWENIGIEQPSGTIELKNERLASALQVKTDFTSTEWDDFGIRNFIHTDHVVQSKGVYFRPLARERTSKKASQDTQTKIRNKIQKAIQPFDDVARVLPYNVSCLTRPRSKVVQSDLQKRIPCLYML